MVRLTKSLGRALIGVGLLTIGAGTAAASGGQPRAKPAAGIRSQAANAQKAASYAAQQQMAVKQIEAAEQRLEQQIQQLQQLGARYPNSPEIRKTLASLQALLQQVQQERTRAEAQVQSPTGAPALRSKKVVSDADVAAAGQQTDSLTQVAEQAETLASEGSQMAAQTTAGLSGPAAPAPAPMAPVERPMVVDDAPPAPQSVQVVPGPAAPRQPVQAAAPSAASESEWFNKLKNGLLQYSVPTTMLWKVASTVTVQVSGQQAPAAPLAGQNGQASIKVAQQMKVLVSAPDNPDEFTIAPEPDTQVQQYVPEDGTTTWHFDVTPKYTASSQRLVVQAWVIDEKNRARELPVYTAVVNVHVPGFGECVKRLFEGDPDYWLKYGLPGGAGFIFVSGLVTGLWKWMRRKKKVRGGG